MTTTLSRGGRWLLAASAGVLAAACAQMPVGPTVAVMPAPNKPFDVFMADDAACRDWASRAVGGPVEDRQAQAVVGSTVAGAAIGGAIGAVAGGHDGARAGAAVGSVMGAATGANQGAYLGYDAQRRYDIAYSQCMYAKGNQLPGGRYAQRAPAPAPYAPPPPGTPPPPPYSPPPPPTAVPR